MKSLNDFLNKFPIKKEEKETEEETIDLLDIAGQWEKDHPPRYALFPEEKPEEKEQEPVTEQEKEPEQEQEQETKKKRRTRKKMQVAEPGEKPGEKPEQEPVTESETEKEKEKEKEKETEIKKVSFLNLEDCSLEINLRSFVINIQGKQIRITEKE